MGGFLNYFMTKSNRRRRSKNKLTEEGNNGRLTHNIEINSEDYNLGRQNGKNFYEHFRFDSVDHGLTFDAKPHFIASGYGKLTQKPGFYLRELKSNTIYTGFLQGTNEKDVCLERDYSVILRSFGPKMKNRTILANLEQRVNPGDMIHVEVVGNSKKNPDKLFGRFYEWLPGRFSYGVFIPPKGDWDFDVKIGDLVFGKAVEVPKGNKYIDFKPIKIVSRERFEKWKNRILS
jgi:hypothetical protein